MKQEINLFSDDVETSNETYPRKKQEDLSLPGVLDNIKEIEERNKVYENAKEQVKRLIEALLFSANEPITLQKIREITDQLHAFKPKELKNILSNLKVEYLDLKRGFRLEENSQGYFLMTCEEFGPYIDLLYRSKRTEKLSQPAAEVLAIIAYRQPITRPHIEQIRGVDCSGVIANLLERELIQPVGKLETAGRPTLYGITQEFLMHFGLKDITELPRLEDS